MYENILIFATVITVLIIILYGGFSSGAGVDGTGMEHLTSTPEPFRWPEKPLFFPLPTTMGELTDLEQMEVVDSMFKDSTQEADKSGEEKQRENDYIKNLPRSSDCEDNYEGCPVWASRGECTINPEYMLYNCASSCEACALNDQEKYNVTYIYNSREPTGCVYHGEDYPSVTRYLHKLHMLSQ